jgi:hypothetical protein
LALESPGKLQQRLSGCCHDCFSLTVDAPLVGFNLVMLAILVSQMPVNVSAFPRLQQGCHCQVCHKLLSFASSKREDAIAALKLSTANFNCSTEWQSMHASMQSIAWPLLPHTHEETEATSAFIRTQDAPNSLNI